MLNSFSFFFRFNAYLPIFGIFLLLQKGFSNEDITKLFFIYSITILIFEVPLGVLADKFNEKYSILLGTLLTFISTALFIFGGFYLIFLGEVLLAIAQTSFSGAFESYVYSYSKNKNLDFGEVFSKNVSWQWLSLAFGSLVCYLCSLYSYQLPLYITMCFNILAFLIIMTLPIYSKGEKKSPLKILKHSLSAFKKNYQLRFWLISSSLYSSLLASGYLLLQPFLNEKNLASSKNGVIYFFITVVAFLGSKFYTRLRKHLIDGRFTLQITCLLLTIIFIFFAFIINNILLLFVLLIIYRLIWGISTPLFVEQVNNNIENSSIRSSIMSMGFMLNNAILSIVLLGASLVRKTTTAYGIFFVISLFLTLIVSIGNLKHKNKIGNRCK